MRLEILPCDFCTEDNRFAQKPSISKRFIGMIGLKLGTYVKCPGPGETVLKSATLEVVDTGKNPTLITESYELCPGKIVDPELSSIEDHILTKREPFLPPSAQAIQD